MSKHTALLTWLRELGRDGLADVLVLRPEAAVPPPPALGQLAERLSNPLSVRRAMEQLDLACIQVLSALQVLGDGASEADLERLLGVPGTVSRAEFDRVLRTLRHRALVWPESGHRLRLIAPLRTAPAAGLGLGTPAATLLKDVAPEHLARLVRRIGCTPSRRRPDNVNRLLSYLRDADRVRAAVADAPPEVRTLLDELVWRSPRLTAAYSQYAPDGVWGDAAQRWLMTCGLLLPVGSAQAELPLEVGLALRGADYTVPVSARPTRPRVVALDQSDVDETASVAAASAVDAVTRVVELCDAQPLAWLRAGGVGVRELRRAAKAVGCGENMARLWLEIAEVAGLLTAAGDVVLPTEAFDGWRARQPGERVGPLMRAWWALEYSPSFVDPEVKPPPAMLSIGRHAHRQLRHDMLTAIATLPPATAIADLDEWVAELAWQQPLAHGDATILAGWARPIWAEAESLGIIAGGAASTLGRLLLGGESEALDAAAARMLPTAHASARFGADLTAVVSGVPSAELSILLDRVADQQSRDTASVWRFSPASVRRALDRGDTAESLLAELARVALGGLPQPLVYLVNDVARRHGALQVIPVACCVCSEDAALVAEIASHRKLRDLRLRLLSPTVLASAAPPRQTLELLREAGYAPVSARRDGTTVVEKVQHQRAEITRALRVHPARLPPEVPVTVPAREELLGLAEQLLVGSDDAGTPAIVRGVTSLTASILRQHTDRLADVEIDVLAYAIDTGSPVLIDYVDVAGKHERREVTPLEFGDGFLTGWCEPRDAERNFLVSNIRAVRAV